MTISQYELMVKSLENNIEFLKRKLADNLLEVETAKKLLDEKEKELEDLFVSQIPF